MFDFDLNCGKAVLGDGEESNYFTGILLEPNRVFILTYSCGAWFTEDYPLIPVRKETHAERMNLSLLVV